ncbi:Cytochrome P450, family 4, subfamily V, polypeptide 2 [Operophtera brumata]|uniref:Cytochrome P450, family 4, subfamily V, polypeptide 2 n=1 Tax=Operophtera brumata TaxID=104452 RepID=A0A0L7LNQ6_OPEBR|nr:Cytochrome P450, family 4, subfamily V, polypeptide 2 [Operophtera brumata]
MDEEKNKVIKTALDNEGFTDEKIKDELNTIVAAGYDTTAISIIYCLLLLGHHQDVQDKLCRELKQVFCDSEREVENEDIAKLVYLEAVLKETFRLYPVVPVVARHTDVDLKLKKHTIPAGCDVFVVTYAVNRHPMWGPDAEQFRPERWLDGTAPTNHNLFASFGLGRRGCIGKTYNMLSMKTTISHVVRRFRITADISKLVLQQDMLLKPASGQHIILEPRKD